MQHVSSLSAPPVRPGGFAGRQLRVSIAGTLLWLVLAACAEESSSLPQPDPAPGEGEVAWSTLASAPDVDPEAITLLAEHRGRVFLFSGKSVREYDAEKDAWGATLAELPVALGTGASVTSDRKKYLFVLAGGLKRDFFRVDPDAKTCELLQPTPLPVGAGGSVAFDPSTGHVFGLRGNRSRNHWKYDLGRNHWSGIGRVGGKLGLSPIGVTTGCLLAQGPYLYAWPDHHVQRYHIERKRWNDASYWSYGVRPHVDGGMWAVDRASGDWLVIPGLGSRSITSGNPETRSFAYLRPRLPSPIRGEGGRMVVVNARGKRQVLVYSTRPQHALFRIPLDALSRVTPQDRRSDGEGAWLTYHEDSGASLVRTMAKTSTPGLMGRAAHLWYLVRLRGTRFFPAAALNNDLPVPGQATTWSQRRWTSYAGVSVGGLLKDGHCAASDGRWVYVTPGGQRGFVRVHVPRKTYHEIRPAEVLPELPDTFGRGAQMVWHEGRIHWMAQGGSAAFGTYDPKAKVHESGPDLPEGARAASGVGTGMVSLGDRLFVIAGNQAWSLAAGKWESALSLPFALHADGGMAVGDPESRRIFLVRGGVSRDFAVIDQDGRAVHRELLPDVVSVPGNRAFLFEFEGERRFAVHRGHDSHEIFMLPLSTVGVDR